MPQPNPIAERPIADYLDALSRAFAFDTALAARVRLEVADHLHESAAACGDSPNVERDAVARFGDIGDIARHYAAPALLARMRGLGVVLIAALALVFVEMELRVAWYGWMRWTASAELQRLNAVGLPLDRYAFFAALALAAVGWAYIGSRRAPAAFDARYGRELGRGIALCAAAAAALAVVVAVETALTGWRLGELSWSAAALVPALTIAAEIACAAVLLRRLGTTVRGAAAALALFR